MHGNPDEQSAAQTALQKLLFARARPPGQFNLEVTAPPADAPPPPPEAPVEPQDLVRVSVALKRLGIGRTKLYELICDGELVALKIGKATMLTSDSIDALISRLPKWRPKRQGRGEEG